MSLRHALFFLILILPLVIQAQTKEKYIDFLFNKYANKDSIMVTNVSGSATLTVEIYLNKNKKPKSIVLQGYAHNTTVAKNIIDELIKEKKKQGYKFNTREPLLIPRPKSFISLALDVYTKGDEYAKYGYENRDWNKTSILGEKSLFKQHSSSYMYLQVGDISRQLNDEGMDFKF